MSAALRLRNVNILYMVTMVLVLAAGSAMQSRSIGWGLIGTELLLILLPSLIYVHKIDPAAKSNVRWRWPGAKAVWAGVLIGAGVQFATAILNGISVYVFGYAVGVPPGFYPATAGDAALLFVAMVILAPLCEEYLFRGVIQPAYEARSPRFAVVVVGLLFALIHMRLQGLLALLPIAFLLGFMVYRSNSLFTGIAAHLGFNAVGFTTAVVFSQAPHMWPLLFAMTLFGGVLSLIIGLVILPRVTVQAGNEPPAPHTTAPRKVGKFAVVLPLLVAVVLYGVMAGAEWITFGNTSILPRPPMQLLPDEVTAPVTLMYAIQDPLGRPVGTARYAFDQHDDAVELTWSVQHDAFEAKVGSSSTYMSGAVEVGGVARWEKATRELLFAQAHSNDIAWTLNVSHDALSVVVQSGERQYPVQYIPYDALLSNEWPWRLSGLPFSLGYRASVPMFYPVTWDASTRDSLPLLEHTSIKVLGAVPLHTPAGQFTVWQVEVGDRDTVFYDVQWPHRVVQYDNGIVTYVLTDWQ